MKTLVFFSIFIGQFTFAQMNVVKWVGQLPTEQAAPIVELFNAQQAETAGFILEYKYDETAVADLLAGKERPEFDVVHMKDADMLNTLARKSLATPVELANESVLPSHLKDPNNQWIGVLKRARILYYNSDLVSEDDLKSYEDLGKSQFKDKLCLRQKKAGYNIALYSFFLGLWGTEKTEKVLKEWADNSAAIPLLEKDLDEVILNVNKGVCAVGVANTYYFMRHLRAEPNTKVKAIMPNQNDIGTHVNVDGIAILKTSAVNVQAQYFANWLLTAEAQATLSDITDKFPVNPTVVSLKLSEVFGTFNESTAFELNSITDLKSEALDIATKQGLK